MQICSARPKDYDVEEARGSDSLTLSEALAVAADPTVYLTQQY